MSFVMVDLLLRPVFILSQLHSLPVCILHIRFEDAGHGRNFRKLYSVVNRQNASELNCGPLSDAIMSGMPCVENSSFRTEMTLVDDWSFSLLISNHLE